MSPLLSCSWTFDGYFYKQSHDNQLVGRDWDSELTSRQKFQYAIGDKTLCDSESVDESQKFYWKIANFNRYFLRSNLITLS